MTAPVFAVVGHVNKGKSSIVAALAEDDAVAVSHEARTTRDCGEFPLRIDGKTLFTLVDTPGFEQARQALAWLREREGSAADRAAVVAEFVRLHHESGLFPEERRLLRPILDGAGILYVVDGSRPFSPEYEAEMEILRWTGRPRMAVINLIGEQDHTARWRAALDQYFSLTRVFDAHEADFDIRLQLLGAFRELREDWRAAIDAAIVDLKAAHARRRRLAAHAIADMIADQLQLVLTKRLPDAADPERFKPELGGKYLKALRERENRERREVEELHRHRSLRRVDDELPELRGDLFSETVWLRLGLAAPQLAAAGAVSGALVGGGVDAALGGASLMIGAAIGGAIGGVSGWLARRSLARVTVYGLKLGGRELRIGPVKNPQFPWIVLDRALLHCQAVRRRSHARRDALSIDGAKGKSGPSSRLPAAQRRSIESSFARVRKARRGEAAATACGRLAREIEALLE